MEKKDLIKILDEILVPIGLKKKVIIGYKMERLFLK